ncbi:MAG TPA: hypothetical protein VJ901_19280 [Thermoanaerobaculia bacterium]|nr:hypothetical protein [Thermoanaerobaculia bacterium]
MRKILTLLSVVVLSACSTSTTTTAPDPMNAASERYVKLVLALGEHDTDYVDAYYGPPEWRDEVKAAKRSVDAIHDDAVALDKELRALPKPSDEMLALRREYLARQTEALIARAEMLKGRKMTFDEESKALYDAVAPHHDEAYFEQLTADLDKELPGAGSLADRIDAFKHDFIIPKDKLDAVFKRAIEGCRARTLQHIELPPGETFTIEYVTNKSWSGYNWYKGDFHSLIQVNTDLPIYIDRAIDLACHEGYPGHHVYNALLEKNLVRDRGWKEFTVYPLFSPQSLIAEGSANYGIDIAFPANERVEFEKANLFPIAGLDASQAAKYYRIQELTAKLGYAGNEAARGYLDGKLTADQAVNWLTKYALMSEPRARQRLKFIEQYRSYVINYNLGKDLVADWVRGDWNRFKLLLSSPRLPSSLR